METNKLFQPSNCESKFKREHQKDSKKATYAFQTLHLKKSGFFHLQMTVHSLQHHLQWCLNQDQIAGNRTGDGCLSLAFICFHKERSVIMNDLATTAHRLFIYGFNTRAARVGERRSGWFSDLRLPV